MSTRRGWTDYPLRKGDVGMVPAPIHEVRVIGWDGDKYVYVRAYGCVFSIKRGYLYSARGRYGKVPVWKSYNLRVMPMADILTLTVLPCGVR